MTARAMETALLRFVNDDLLAGATNPVGSDDEIVLDGTVDSLGVARLLGFLESEFAVSVPAEDVTIENFQTIRTLADYAYRRIELGSAS